MSYQLIQIFELENISRLSTYIEQTLTRQGTYDENKQVYLEQFKEQTNNYLQKKDYISVLELLFDARLKFRLDNKFLQTIPALTSYFIQQCNQKEKKEELLQAFIHLNDKETQYSINQKLNLYGILFNGLDKESNIQLELFKEIINFSKKHDKLSVLNNSLVNLDEITQGWKISNDKKQGLYQHIINVLDKQKYQELKCKLIIKYLQSFNSINNEENEFSKKQILYLILQGQILSEYNNIFESQGMQYLEKSNSDLYQIFSFFITGDVQGYLNFKNQKPNAIKSLNINEDQYSEKVRVQSIGRITKSGEIITLC
ncbi:pci domain protein [Ichthyophthirius multifiliis]|uniref:Pci domain protein n=1 Tax=Ichthyophthirius multifiliis TaxID=5932 RepID=G0QTB3_ICHMU|nr:pci domain protein [Ichthyophthirius multifiliis]EGR31548.1 pci domain protein [Ichthyophthirius multifiliis]|eukprot:XP_004035034.1 pci domain protein [Ichthyophthirius multifiliis]